MVIFPDVPEFMNVFSGVFFCTPHNVSHRSYLNNKFLYSVKYHITAMRRGSFVREADCVNLEN